MAKRKFSAMMLIPPLIFLGIGALFVVGLNRPNSRNLPSTIIGRETPNLTLTELPGYPMITEEVLRAPGVKLLNFWASWCVGCRLEHPFLVKMAKNGGQIYGVDYKDNDGAKFLTEKENPYVGVSEDKLGRTAIDWGVYGIPETFIIDGNGVVTHRHIGAITEDVMKNVIMPKMAEAAANTQTAPATDAAPGS